MEDTFTDIREQRLPRWARRELDLLRQNLAHERSRLSVVVGEREPSRILVQPFETPRHYLPDHYSVRFLTEGNDDIEMRSTYIDVRLRDGWVEVMGGTQLVVRPQVSNVIAVKVQPR